MQPICSRRRKTIDRRTGRKQVLGYVENLIVYWRIVRQGERNEFRLWLFATEKFMVHVWAGGWRMAIRTGKWNRLINVYKQSITIKSDVQIVPKRKVYENKLNFIFMCPKQFISMKYGCDGTNQSIDALFTNTTHLQARIPHFAQMRNLTKLLNNYLIWESNS